MNTKAFNLFFMVIWLCVLIGLLTRSLWMQPELQEKVNVPHLPMVIALAGALALWNFVRFLVSHLFNRPPDQTQLNALRQHIRSRMGDDPKITDPQFKFDDPPK